LIKQSPKLTHKGAKAVLEAAERRAAAIGVPLLWVFMAQVQRWNLWWLGVAAGAYALTHVLAAWVLVLSGAELRLLQRLCAVGLPVARAGYPRDGERVQVAQGPLQGVSGVLEQRQPLTLFVPIATLQTSVGVRIDGAQLIPCEVAQETPVSHLSWEV